MFNIENPKWMDSANCLGTDAEAFFPEVGDTAQLALRTCRACLVKTECLNYALENEITEGIWGGMNYKRRKYFQRTGKVAA